jgi:hypothetical protein
MATVHEDNSAPTIRFKRRKTTHPKRVQLEEDAPVVSTQSPNAAIPNDALSLSLPNGAKDEEETIPNLKEILRNRKRPRDRLKETARKPEVTRTELVQVDAPRPDQYTSRFVAQTGQVVERDDKQM